MVIDPKEYFRAKTADSLTPLRSGGYGGKYGATNFVKETKGTGTEFPFQIGARHFLQGCMNAPLQWERMQNGSAACTSPTSPLKAAILSS